MKDFTIRMADGREYLIRGERMRDVLYLIGSARLTMNGWLDVRLHPLDKGVTINVDQIISIEEGDED